ncbi:glycosyltransferase family 4 protein [Oceanobacillus halophilus]|uniref:Glycosyltransferase family 1 protein n=1 Tax=Oceanobacillus halophilus TaxID=930130 RepID=A0A495A4E6_9BACI|nr:glycosyltransferase family 4 protein [Oceanobacillus halophilus]RKQ34282.1 glycosyltransferase family 1 protein [Oceanobacillus halophilus]
MKILYVTTISNTMGFFTDHINMLLDQGHTVDMACNMVKPINSELIRRGCKVYNLEFQRSPLRKENYSAYRKLKKLIHDEKYDLVHTHTPIASFCARLACRNMDNVKMIYTAHGFHFFKGAPLKNWLLYYPSERWMAKYTNVIITINKEDYERANSSFKAKSVKYVPGVGIETKRFSEVNVDKTIKRRDLGVPDGAYIMLSLGELNRNKNHETVIKAVAKLNNPNYYYLICGQGPYENQLKELIEELGLKEQVKLLGYRNDIAEICKVSDVFIFPSFREGLSVALMEAMASGLSVICSDIRGNRDLIINDKGGYLVNPNDVDGFAMYIDKILKSPMLRDEFSFFNQNRIKKFDKNNVLKNISNIYKNSHEEEIN